MIKFLFDHLLCDFNIRYPGISEYIGWCWNVVVFLGEYTCVKLVQCFSLVFIARSCYTIVVQFRDTGFDTGFAFDVFVEPLWISMRSNGF